MGNCQRHRGAGSSRNGLQTRPSQMVFRLQETKSMIKRDIEKLVHGGEYVAKVRVALIENEH